MSRKTYRIVMVEKNGKGNVYRTNDGFNAFELLGLLSHAIREIHQQIDGELKPVTERKVITKPLATSEPEEYEPYFGWCDVEGCENEGCSGGSYFRETGFWTICHEHAKDSRDGKPAPQMKQKAIDREKSRDPKTGYLPIETQR